MPDVSSCTNCSRLSDFLSELRQEHSDYYNLPVNAFGDDKARLLIVGLAPGKHGANATGRPFTGDYAGVLLYQSLFKYGFANKSESENIEDGLELINCRITNAVKCLPPQNKPLGTEINACNHYLEQELAEMPDNSVIMALGGIAHKAVLKARNLKQSPYKFAHLAEHDIGSGLRLIDSYHCSRYNTQTKRLTTKMFENVFQQVVDRLAQSGQSPE